MMHWVAGGGQQPMFITINYLNLSLLELKQHSMASASSIWSLIHQYNKLVANSTRQILPCERWYSPWLMSWSVWFPAGDSASPPRSCRPRPCRGGPAWSWPAPWGCCRTPPPPSSSTWPHIWKTLCQHKRRQGHRPGHLWNMTWAYTIILSPMRLTCSKLWWYSQTPLDLLCPITLAECLHHLNCNNVRVKCLHGKASTA